MCQVCHEMRTGRDCGPRCQCHQCLADSDRCTNWVYDPPQDSSHAPTPQEDQEFADIINKLRLAGGGEGAAALVAMDTE